LLCGDVEANQDHSLACGKIQERQDKLRKKSCHSGQVRSRNNPPQIGIHLGQTPHLFVQTHRVPSSYKEIIKIRKDFKQVYIVCSGDFNARVGNAKNLFQNDKYMPVIDDALGGHENTCTFNIPGKSPDGIVNKFGKTLLYLCNIFEVFIVFVVFLSRTSNFSAIWRLSPLGPKKNKMCYQNTNAPV
jgi:hypothetical protein